MTFYNGDYNPASPGMGPFELTAGTSGVTLPAAGAPIPTITARPTPTRPPPATTPDVDAMRFAPGGKHGRQFELHDQVSGARELKPPSLRVFAQLLVTRSLLLAASLGRSFEERHGFERRIECVAGEP